MAQLRKLTVVERQVLAQALHDFLINKADYIIDADKVTRRLQTALDHDCFHLTLIDEVAQHFE